MLSFDPGSFNSKEHKMPFKLATPKCIISHENTRASVGCRGGATDRLVFSSFIEVLGLLSSLCFIPVLVLPSPWQYEFPGPHLAEDGVRLSP